MRGWFNSVPRNLDTVPHFLPRNGNLLLFLPQDRTQIGSHQAQKKDPLVLNQRAFRRASIGPRNDLLLVSDAQLLVPHDRQAEQSDDEQNQNRRLRRINQELLPFPSTAAVRRKNLPALGGKRANRRRGCCHEFGVCSKGIW